VRMCHERNRRVRNGNSAIEFVTNYRKKVKNGS
jgi:hypothetical protein